MLKEDKTFCCYGNQQLAFFFKVFVQNGKMGESFFHKVQKGVWASSMRKFVFSSLSLGI